MASTPIQQPFSPVIVNLCDVRDEELRMKIEAQMSDYEIARSRFTEATNKLQEAQAELLEATGRRSRSRVQVVRSFAEAVERVALEPNWEPFRDRDGKPAVENFMSERDQRNYVRLQRAQMNKQVSEGKLNTQGLFEDPSGNE